MAPFRGQEVTEIMNAPIKTMDVVVAELERSLAETQAKYKLLLSIVDTDELTRLLRRGAFMRRLRNLLQTSAAEGKEVNVMMIDVDHFKHVNDRYGHQTGDVVLERVSQLISQYVRPQDLAGRYGGEEIIVAMEGSRAEAAKIAENIRAAVEAHTMKTVDSTAEFNVTLSVGVASTHQFKHEADVLIGHADEALYRAKNTGRNRVVEARKTAQLKLVSLEYQQAA